MGSLPGVSLGNEGEVLIWPSATICDDFCRRKTDGRWVFGAEARPTMEELEQSFAVCFDRLCCATLIHEARAAYERIRGGRPADHGSQSFEPASPVAAARYLSSG